MIYGITSTLIQSYSIAHGNTFTRLYTHASQQSRVYSVPQCYTCSFTFTYKVAVFNLAETLTRAKQNRDRKAVCKIDVNEIPSECKICTC